MGTVLDTGCHAVAMAVCNAKVDVVAAYPITPQTSIVEAIAEMVEKGTMATRFLPVEGEHSAMAACTAASAGGARVFTATSSQGLLYMHEVLHMAAGGRLPVVMANVNRAVFPPWSIYVDHQDSLAQRDTGWLQFYCASLQEIYDTILQAFKIAETVSLPVMVNLDGFILSHASMPFFVQEQEVVDKFLPPFEPSWVLDTTNPNSFGNVTDQSVYHLYRKMLQEATLDSLPVIKNVAKEYKDLTGFWHGDTFEPYKTDDADVLVLSMGSMAAEVESSIDMLRKEGHKVGALRLRLFRPFPADDLAAYVAGKKQLIVLDRNHAFGNEGGILFNEAKVALFGKNNEIKLANKIMGIGGMDLNWQTMAAEIRALLEG